MDFRSPCSASFIFKVTTFSIFFLSVNLELSATEFLFCCLTICTSSKMSRRVVVLKESLDQTKLLRRRSVLSRLIILGLFNDAFSNSWDYIGSNNKAGNESCFGNDVEGEGVLIKFQCLYGLRRTTKTSVKIADFQAAIWRWDISNANHERYSYSQHVFVIWTYAYTSWTFDLKLLPSLAE